MKVNGEIYHRIIQGKDLIADILPPPQNIIESYLVSLQLLGTAEKPQQIVLIDRLAALHSEVETRFIELEITESLLMENTAEVADTLRKLSAMGLEISIDDFGTGYSSLSYLKRFPINSLKIDRSFVMDITTDADDTAIVIAIIALAHSLQMKVIAEGVETGQQLEFLHEQGCDQYQGYDFSEPLSASDAVTQLLQRRA